jgi:hypothetical protein
MWLGYITGSQAGSGIDISDMDIDWVMVRKYAYPEPAFSFGAEETTMLFTLVSGIDASTGIATDSNSGISNSIRILQRSLVLASDVYDLGTIQCGQTGSAANTTASNTGNGNLSMVRWEPTDLQSSQGEIISKTNLILSPDPIGPIPAASELPASITLFVPFSQATGTYIATMTIYDDVNGNMLRDLSAPAEPVDFFQVRAVVPVSRSISVVEDLIDLGSWDVGMTAASVPVNAFNSGNDTLTGLEFKQIVGTNSFSIDVNPLAPGNLATDSFLSADVTADLTVGPAGTYIATWTLWDDFNGDHIIDAGEASDSFMVKISVGMASITINPATLDMGIGTPSTIISEQTNITNSGQVALGNLRSRLNPLEDGIGNSIPTSEILISMPVIIPQSETRIATVTVAVPAGTIAGTYNGIQWVYDDRNGDEIINDDEASASVLLTVVIPQIRKVEVYPDDVNMGGIIPGNSKTLLLDCRNIGNTELTGMRWQKTDLQSGGQVLDATNASFPPAEPFYVATGAFFTHEIRLSAPAMQASGSYLSIPPHYWLFNDDNSDLGVSVGEPQDIFTLRCQIGSKAIDIVENSLSSVGDPGQLSPAISFLVKNTGDLMLNNLKAKTTDLTPVVPGPPAINFAANIVNPVSISGLAVGQSKNGNWQVDVPDGTQAATYSGTLTIWKDENDDNTIDAGEVSDSANLLLTVNSKKVIKVIQDPLNLGWTLVNSTVEGAIEIVNSGNVDIDLATPLASEMVSLGQTIPTGSITFTPIGNIPVGTAKLATVTLNVGYPRTDGTYAGSQRIFDDYSAADGNYTSNEESCLFEMIINIGFKKLSVTNPVVFAATTPGQTVTRLFSVTNETSIPLTKIKWLPGPMVSGADIIPVASLSFSPPPYFGIGGGNSRSSAVDAILGATLPSGNYIGTHTVWEDNNGDGLIQASEASSTFNTLLTVGDVSGLDIINVSINAGQIAAGSTSPWVVVLFTNTGNVNLTSADLYWNFSAMTDGLGNNIAAASLVASTTIQPDPVLPGQLGKAYFRIGPITPGQASGVYYGNSQTLTDGLTASDFCQFECEIIAGGPQNLDSDAVYQNIATTTFPAPAQRFFFSAYVCPGSGSAKLSLLGRDGDDINTTQALGVEIDANGTLTTFGPLIQNAGILDTIPTYDSSEFTWYRVFFSFDYAYDPLVASRTYVSLQNSSPDTASYSVWFDGIQLEKSILTDQKRPTTFNQKNKILSPNPKNTITGETYPEW